jgi:hypothetical protein
MNDNDLILTVLCPRCGEVDLQQDEVWLVLSSVVDRSHYGFRCPDCQRGVSVPASDAVIAVLVELVAVEQLDVPAEALETQDGPALTVDDLLDLMLALDGTEVLSHAA